MQEITEKPPFPFADGQSITEEVKTVLSQIIDTVVNEYRADNSAIFFGESQLNSTYLMRAGE